MPRDARPALTPACPQVTRGTQGPDGVTVAGVTAGATVNVPVGVPALVTPRPLHIAPAHTLASPGVTLRLPSPGPVALAGHAARAPGHRVPPVARPAQLAPLPRRVARALEAGPRHGLTVAGAAQVNVPVALTLDTRPGGSAQTLGVSVIPVPALLAPGARPPRGALGADDRGPGQVAPAQSGGAVLRGHLGTRARLTVIWSGGTCVPIVSISTRVTRVPHCVMGAVAHASVHVAVVGVTVTAAGHTFSRDLVMEVSWLTGLAVLALVSHGTLALFNPFGRVSSSSGLKEFYFMYLCTLDYFDHLIYQSSFQLHSIDESLSRGEVCSPDPYCRQVVQYLHILRRAQLRPPAQALVLVKSELIRLEVLIWPRVTLSRHRD